MGNHTSTYTATLRTCRNGTSWRTDVSYSSQGMTPSYDTAQRVGYIGFGSSMNLALKSITKIVLTFTYGSAGIGNHTDKTLGFYKWEGNLSPSKYTSSNLLGTLTSKNQYDGTRSFTFDATTNSALFYKFKEYFECGNRELIICRPDDVKTHSYTDSSGKPYTFTDNYLIITAASITVTYDDTYNMDVNYKVNGTYHYSGSTDAGTFNATVDGVQVATYFCDLNHRAVSGTSYKVEAVPSNGWVGQNSPVTGTYPSNDFSVVLDFRQQYEIAYNNGGGGTTPAKQTKTNGTNLKLRDAIARRPSTSAGSYTVSLFPQNGSAPSYLIADRTTSYTFKHWKSSYDGKSYGAAKPDYSVEAPTTMTAVWDPTTSTAKVKLPEPTKPGYTFLGWTDVVPATSYIPAGDYEPSDNVALYAMWAAEGLVMIDNGSTFVPHTIWIDNGTSWDQYMAYIDTGTEWKLCNE